MNDTCLLNETVTQKNKLISNSGNYVLHMVANGTLNIVCKEQSIWSTGDSYTDAEGLYLDSDGHLVIYNSDGKIIWTFLVESGKPKGERLLLQNDGNLVLRANDQSVLWASGSIGRCPAGLKSQKQSL